MFDPVLLIAVVADGIAAFVLFAFFGRSREIRWRLLPLCILTLVHTILVLLCNYCDAKAVIKVLRDIYFFAPLVLLLFYQIYTIVLSELSRNPRPLGISGFVFCANIIFQGLLAFIVLIGGYTS